MTDKEFTDLQSQIKKLIKLSKQLKESNMHLLKKNSELLIREKELVEGLNGSGKKIKKLIKNLKEESN